MGYLFSPDNWRWVWTENNARFLLEGFVINLEIAVIAIVLALIVVDGSPAWVDALVYATVVVTVVSAGDYFFNFRALVQARPSSHSRIDT